MADQVHMFIIGTRAFGERVHAVRADQWSQPTPDSEWTVADLVAHLVDEHRWVAPLLHGLDFAAAGDVVAGTRDLPVDGGVGANLAQAWDEAATASHDAVVAEGVLERTVALARGDTDTATYLDEMILDLTVHAWDLGTAITYGAAVPAELVEHVQAVGVGDLSGSGMFAEPVEVADDASPLDKLIAATGRDPRA